MPTALNLYHDQIGGGGATASALPAAHRMLYVRHGRVEINGRVLGADDAIYADSAVMQSSYTYDWNRRLSTAVTWHPTGVPAWTANPPVISPPPQVSGPPSTLQPRQNASAAALIGSFRRPPNNRVGGWLGG